MNALYNNTTGNNNTAAGYQALLNNTTGSFNIAVGNAAGANLTTGINNIDIGNNGVAGSRRPFEWASKGSKPLPMSLGLAGQPSPAASRS